MKSLSVVLVVSLFFLVVRTGNAQNTGNHVPSQTLTLDSAIDIALRQNYLIRINANQAQKADVEVTRSKDAFLPSVSASADYSYKYSLVPLSERTLPVSADTSVPTASRTIIFPAGSHGLSYNLGANFNIFNGGSDAARLRSSQFQLESANQNFVWTKQQIAFTVVSDYLNALRFRALVQAAEATLSESKAELLRNQGLFQAGSVPIIQVYQQQSVVSNNELSLIQARNNFENAKADLLFQLDLPPTSYHNYDLDLTGIDTNTTRSHRVVVDSQFSENMIDQVIDARPDLQSARAQISSSEAAIDITRGALLPRLDASLGIGGSGSNADLFRVHTTNGIQGDLSLQVPIFDRYQNRLLITEQEIDVESSRERLQQQIEQLRSDAAKALNNLLASEDALDASEVSLRSSEESLRLAEERFRVGAGIQLDVLVAESALETARINRVNAKFNYVLALKQLQFTLNQWHY